MRRFSLVRVIKPPKVLAQVPINRSTLQSTDQTSMTNFRYSDGIAVWKLVYYTVALFGSIKVSWRHGFGKNSGWIYLAIFCVIRIINSSAELASLSPSNSDAITVAAVTSFLGLSPLLLAALGLLSRMSVFDGTRHPQC
jgi:hypothetical protein